MNKKTLIILMILVMSSLIAGCVKPQPQYKTETYQEPVYGTLYYGTLTHIVGHWYGTSTTTETFDNAVKYTTTYSGMGAGGREEYTFTTTDWQGRETQYFQKCCFDIHEKPGIIRYDTKTRQVCVANCN